MGGGAHGRLEEEPGLDNVCRGKPEEGEEEEEEDDVDDIPECSGVAGSALVCMTEGCICRGRSGTGAQTCRGDPPGREPS